MTFQRWFRTLGLNAQLLQSRFFCVNEFLPFHRQMTSALVEKSTIYGMKEGWVIGIARESSVFHKE